MSYRFVQTNGVPDAKASTLWARGRSVCSAYFSENPIEYILHPVSSRISSFGLVMLLGNPFYYWIWAHVLVQPYENLAARLAVTVLGAVLLLPKINRHPTSLLTGLVFVGVVWLQLPVFFIWMYLCNGGAPVWMATVVGMILIWYHVTDWRIATLGLVLATPLAWGLFSITEVPTLPAWSEQNIATHAVVIGFGLFLAMMLGVFSANAKQIQMKLSQARALQMALQSLAGSIAHEMRNPLGQIKHAITMSGDLLPAEGNAHGAVLTSQQLRELHRYLKQGHVAIRRGLQVIDMTLDEVNFRPLDTTQFVFLSAAKTVQKALDEYDFDSVSERSKIHVEQLQDFDFKGHETALVFVLFNLMRNALHYFKQYPSATMTITIEPYRIRVKDTGPGIAEPMRARLFEAFETSGKVGGTGLGLVYCRRVMQAFGGDIACDSVQGQFTEFILQFAPLSDAEKHSMHVMNAASEGVAHEAVPAAPEPCAVLRGKTLLVADDMAMNRNILSAYAQRWGMRVLEAQHGQEALALLDGPREKVDAVILDLHMPGLGGIEVTRILRASVRHKDLPILALTGLSDAHSRQLALDAGMNDFVTKPFEGAVLQQKLSRLLAASEQTTALPTTSPTTVSNGFFLLDLARLQELQQHLPAILAKSWPMYVENLNQLQARMRQALESRNLEELHRAIHALVGNSGNVGALAVHLFLKFQVMPEIEKGQWPRDEHWEEILTDLCLRTDEQMSQYLSQQALASSHA